MTKLIILDRDGVINFDSPHFIKSPEEWQPIPGSLEGISALYKAGFTIVVASNQSGLGRGLFTETTIHSIHHKMHSAIAALGGKIDDIYFCPHLPEEKCVCRKPLPGLFTTILKKYNINNNTNLILSIGDSLRDLEASYAAGVSPLLVKTGNGNKTAAMLPTHLQAIPQFDNLLEATQCILTSNDFTLPPCK